MKDSFRRSLLMAVLILLIFGGIYQYQGTKKPSYAISETEIIFSAPAGFEDLSNITIAIADITDLALGEMTDPGTCVEGCDTADSRYGLWNSETLGDYYVSADPDIDVCLVAKTDSGTYIFNIESADTTTQLYSEIKKLMEE